MWVLIINRSELTLPRNKKSKYLKIYIFFILIQHKKNQLEKCFKNFLDTLNPSKTKLTVVFDGAIENNFILKYKDKYKLLQLDDII